MTKGKKKLYLSDERKAEVPKDEARLYKEKKTGACTPEWGKEKFAWQLVWLHAVKSCKHMQVHASWWINY